MPTENLFRIATTDDDLRKCFIVRGIVFIEGQQCPYHEEVDQHEAGSTHILGELDGQPVAAARIRFLDDYAKLERIAVRDRWRGRGYGRLLTEYMIQVATERGYHRFQMHAQAHLLEFYARLGFTVEGEMFQEAGIDHYLMVRQDSLAVEAIPVAAESDGDLLCIAHRGASGHAPENTLLAIRMALELGAPWIEIDVQQVGGQLLVFHDRTLERTTNGRGNLADHPVEYLRSLDAGRGEKIPLLGEVLELIGPRAGLNIELKGAGTAAPVTDLIGEFVKGGGWSYDRLLVSSFDLAELRRVKESRPEIPIAPLFSRCSLSQVKTALRLDAFCINVGWHHLTAEFVKEAHDAELGVYVYTVNNSVELARMRRFQVEGVFTDFPELLLGSDPGSLSHE